MGYGINPRWAWRRIALLLRKEPAFVRAVRAVIREGRGSTALLQRELGIGYRQAAWMLARMEELGIVVLTNAIGSNHALYARKAAALLRPAVKAASKKSEDQPERNPDFDRYVGVYDTVWGREAIVRWKDGLAAVGLTSRAVKPDDWIAPLKHVEGHVFRRIRTDDESLGEEWIFEVDENGRVLSVTTHSNPSTRVR